MRIAALRSVVTSHHPYGRRGGSVLRIAWPIEPRSRRTCLLPTAAALARSAQSGHYPPMSDERKVRTKHTELTLEEIAEALPGTGDVMSRVAEEWWRCAYAARGRNWPLAAYYARRVRSLQRGLAVIRPKYKERLDSFDAGPLAAVFAALETQDPDAFERAFADATDVANRNHVETGYGYIRWKLPDDAPKDVDLERH